MKSIPRTPCIRSQTTVVHRLAITLLVFVAGNGQANDAMPPSFEESQAEPVVYRGDESADPRFHHGGFSQAVGVHQYQALRANRTQAPEGGTVGWTYNHAPMLAYWNGRFWLNYVSNLVEEHGIPGRTGLISSADGRHWEKPGIAFPVVALPEILPPPRYFGGKQLDPVPEGTGSIMHQRMGWYVAPDGRLLTSGFYSYCPNVRWGPNRGQGLGRVVREVYPDGSLGPIFFIRYNSHADWDETNTPFPFFTESTDPGFVAACEALLQDKLVTLQWWEDDRGNDGFFTYQVPDDLLPGALTFGTIPEDDPEYIEPKALSYFKRPDGVTVGVWKNGLATLSPDDGLTWTKGIHNLPESSAKIWGQRTDDGRYALVYDHSATLRNRFPLVVITGDDGYAFDHLLNVHAEVPPMRYRGVNKAFGPQYIRGIIPGNGNPPGDHLWLTYSVNKEDLWVSNVRVPIIGTVSSHVDQSFEGLDSEADLEWWNLYVPQWAPVSIVPDPWNPDNRCLELRDEEPYDYAKAERIIPATERLRVTFKLLQRAYGLNGLEFEVQTARGGRLMRLWFDPDEVAFDLDGVEVTRGPFDLGAWHEISIELDCAEETYSCAVDGEWIHRDLELQGDIDAAQRLVFRTGPWRMDVRQYLLPGEPSAPGVWDADLPGADIKTKASAYLIDDVRTEAY
jgi:hypothetical protein